jgi:hypothetical protein
MKKIVLTMIAAVMMGATAMAQQANPNNGERRQFDPQEMVKQRTEATAKKYGLNEEQTQKLLDLNTRYQGKIGPMGGMGGMRQGQGRRQMGQRPQGQAPRRAQNDSVRSERPRPQGGQGNFGGANREEMRKNMEAYEAELKTIMTEEQYKAYQNDSVSRRPMRRGDRPARNNNN